MITSERPRADSAALTAKINNINRLPTTSSKYVEKNKMLKDMLNNMTSNDIIVSMTFLRLKNTPAIPVTNNTIAVAK